MIKMDRGCCKRVLGLSLILAAWTSSAPLAHAGDDFAPSFRKGIEDSKFFLTSRSRYEHVDQEGFTKSANSHTIMFRPGIETGLIYGFRFGVEGDLIAEGFADDFNNGSNGKTQYPAVIDVESAEVNRAYIESHHLPGVVITGGRYKADLDNWRHIGSVLWRQNDQTFDGATVEISAIPNVDIYYGYIGNVNRIFSDDGPDGTPRDGNLTSNIHNINVKAKLPGTLGSATGYTYLMDMLDFAPFSNATYGGFIKGKQKLGAGLTFLYRVEYARQTDYGNQPLSYEADYWHIQPGLSAMGFTATLGYEKLGSDNGLKGFQTPLATGHKFNGFADLFLATPAEGLEDFYVDLTYKLKNAPPSLSFFEGLLIKGQYHEFRSDVGDLDFGSEFDLYIKQPLKFYKGLSADLKYANYDGGGSRFPDTEKFTLGLNYKY